MLKLVHSGFWSANEGVTLRRSIVSDTFSLNIKLKFALKRYPASRSTEMFVANSPCNKQLVARGCSRSETSDFIETIRRI